MSSPVVHVVGARPNYMKMAPLLAAFAADADRQHVLVHTGQHYDPILNDAIFRDLNLRAPDVHLGVGSGTHAEQTARVMTEFEKVVRSLQPALVVVAGDVNSTLGCAIVAAKACVPVAHVEAGLRSFDRTMPEEINRVVTDRLAALLLTPSADADENLRAEGAAAESIVRVGNLMVDSLRAHLERARSGDALATLELAPREFALLTLHRPSNVDDPEALRRLFGAILAVANELPLVFPVHPRTRARLMAGELGEEISRSRGLRVVDPLGYLAFLQLQDAARFVLTDSGGVQEETTALGVPCLTIRENTERPITITHGSNILVGTDPERILCEAKRILSGDEKRGLVPDLWDGHAGPRAAAAINSFLATLQPLRSERL